MPYVASYGMITKVLEAVKRASTPDRFTYEFLADTIGMKGGSPKALVPYLKRIGFLGSDGVPTDLYRAFRNPNAAGPAAAAALRQGYAVLFQMDENVHKATDAVLKGLIVQATGAQPDSTTVKQVLGSFKALRAFAADDVEAGTATLIEESDADVAADVPTEPGGREDRVRGGALGTLNFGYTINLHLPATSDIAVHNAIFKSLREHLLR